MTTPGRALAIIASAQLLVLGLWFSASAVAPQLVEAWDLSTGQAAGLTMAVQLGFVAGALTSAVFSLADIWPARYLFIVAAIVGAGANLALVAVETPLPALSLRFVTGIALAFVYPSGMKIMAGWFTRSRGMALGVLVGALTVGSASPHLVLGLGLEWQGVMVAASGFAIVGAVLMVFTRDGPHMAPPRPFAWALVGTVIRTPGWRRSTGGYLGHMWELYAMWTWIAAWIAASALAADRAYPDTSVVAFTVIAVGGVGSWLAGIFADRVGRPRVAGGAMVVSGSVALMSPLLFGMSPLVVVPVLLLWGVTVVADSAQFSAMATETVEPDTIGTALTLQTALGFLLTVVSIRLVPLLADGLGWRWAFPILAIGPALGTLAMVSQARADRLDAGLAR